MLIHCQDAGHSWCPFGRRPFGDEGAGFASVNRQTGMPPEETSPSRGLRCMAWRWAATSTDGKDEDVAGMGYCGLAGEVRE